jgi:subtilase family serine protease
VLIAIQRVTLALAVAGMTAAVSAGGAVAAAPRARVGSVPRLPGASRVTGPVRAGRRIALVLSLASRDPLGMERMATAVATPGSPSYRRYLTVPEFAARFGAPPAHLAAVTRVLRGAGLAVAPTGANHLTLSVSGTAAAVQRAFATRLASVRTADGRRAFADRRAPTLPARLAPEVQSVVGLNTLSRPGSDELADLDRGRHPALAPAASPNVVTGGPQPCVAATAAATNPNGGGYTADEIAAAYDFSGLYALGDTGAGQTIAVYELEKLDPSDVSAYQSCYGTSARVSYVNVGHPQSSGSDEESALDVEQILGLAPGAHVIVYQAADTAEAGLREYNAIISGDRAKTISVSWGSCEAKATLDGSDLSIVKMENTLFQEAALQGQSILVASGDTGSAACVRDLGSRELSVQDPSSQPFATGVGGTTLYTGSPGDAGLWNPAVPTDPLLESVWNDGEFRTSTGRQPAASTGGISKLWSMPGYQSKAAPGLGVINADSSGAPCGSRECREVPDVSADGDPASGYVVHVTSGRRSVWTIEGGTSAAAPLWAALTAEADALPNCRGTTLGFENPDLYGLAALVPTDLKDITTASPLTGDADNDAIGANRGLYPVTTGYDMTTGLGTPSATALAGGLCLLRAPVYSVTLASPGDHRARAGTAFRLALTAADSGKLPLTYTATGLPRGLTISRGGVISGRARRTGRFSVTVTAEDTATNRASVSFTLTVLPAPGTVSHVSLHGVARRRPVLAFTVTRARHGARLHAVTVRPPRGLTLGRRGRGIRVSAHGHRIHFHARRGAAGLRLTLTRAQSSIRISLMRPSLFASARLARTARNVRGARIAVAISVTDTHRATARRTYRLRLRPRS